MSFPVLGDTAETMAFAPGLPCRDNWLLLKCYSAVPDLEECFASTGLDGARRRGWALSQRSAKKRIECMKQKHSADTCAQS